MPKETNIVLELFTDPMLIPLSGGLNRKRSLNYRNEDIRVYWRGYEKVDSKQQEKGILEGLGYTGDVRWGIYVQLKSANTNKNIWHDHSKQ